MKERCDVCNEDYPKNKGRLGMCMDCWEAIHEEQIIKELEYELR